MPRVAIGVFDSRNQAERAVEELRNKGFEKEISVVTRDGGRAKETDNEMKMEADRDTAIEGVTYGSALGGLAGLAAGAGALVIPGIGPILA
ncbi:MAG: general stress protein, partial [Thermacetogeniaceae bacterium]